MLHKEGFFLKMPENFGFVVYSLWFFGSNTMIDIHFSVYETTVIHQEYSP